MLAYFIRIISLIYFSNRVDYKKAFLCPFVLLILYRIFDGVYEERKNIKTILASMKYANIYGMFVMLERI